MPIRAAWRLPGLDLVDAPDPAVHARQLRRRIDSCPH